MYNDRQEMTLDFFSIPYFISAFEILRYGISTCILMWDFSKGLTKFILNFGGTELFESRCINLITLVALYIDVK